MRSDNSVDALMIMSKVTFVRFRRMAFSEVSWAIWLCTSARVAGGGGNGGGGNGGSAGGAGGRETGDDGEAEGGGGESGGDEGARMRTCVTMGLVAPSTVTPTAALSANRLLASPCIVLRTLLAADASVNVTVAFTLTLAALTSRLMSAGGTPR